MTVTPGVVLAFATTLLPTAVWACPACATRESPGMSTFVLVCAMIGVPYVIGAVALKIIRALDQPPGGPDVAP